MSEVVLQIVGPDFVAGIVVRNRIVVETAPKVREFKGWRFDWVLPQLEPLLSGVDLVYLGQCPLCGEFFVGTDDPANIKVTADGEEYLDRGAMLVEGDWRR